MDVVYVVGPGEENDELRYSLRSLRNLPHGSVWIAGYIPKWVTGVGRIPTKQASNKYANSAANLRAACLHPEVSEEFVYFNDDFFVMQPIDAMPVYHRGPMRVLGGDRRRRVISYRGGAADTFRLLNRLGITDPLAYEPIHTPMPMHKARMLASLEAGKDVGALWYRTLYGNQWAVGGTEHPNVKIGTRRRKPDPDARFLSTRHKSWGGFAGQFVRKRFPDPSPYEV